MRLRRKAASARERADASAAVCAKLEALGKSAVVAVYLASPDEIDISPYIRRMLLHKVRLVAPRWNGEDYDLAELKGLEPRHLRRGPMGILEPLEGCFVQPQDVSLWVVPGLAFTRDGRRLGYGGGWYDRLLAAASKDSVKLGVAYSFQIVDALPTAPHDVRLTAVVDDSPPGEAARRIML